MISPVLVADSGTSCMGASAPVRASFIGLLNFLRFAGEWVLLLACEPINPVFRPEAVPLDSLARRTFAI